MLAYEQYTLNLQRLEEQAARYGMSPPLYLINDIEFHKRKLHEAGEERPIFACCRYSVSPQSDALLLIASTAIFFLILDSFCDLFTCFLFLALYIS